MDIAVDLEETPPLAVTSLADGERVDDALADPRDSAFDQMAEQSFSDDLPPSVLDDITELVRGDQIGERCISWEDGSWDRAPAWTHDRRDVHAIDLSILDIANGRLLRHRKGVALGTGAWLHAIEAPVEGMLDHIEIIFGRIESDHLGTALVAQIDLLTTRYDAVSGLPCIRLYSLKAERRTSQGARREWMFRSRDGEFGPYGVEILIRKPVR